MLQSDVNLLMSRIKVIAFPENQYVKEETQKSQIYLHHTVSPGISIDGDLQHWLSTTARVATHVIISQNGTINQVFNSKYWGYHLGLKNEHFKAQSIAYKNLDALSLAIELDSIGPVDKFGNSIAYGAKVRTNNIVEHVGSYRGFKYFEKYTIEQLDSLKLLLLFWCEKYSIPTTYNEDMWSVSKRALSGESGIWSHTSVRPDKSDVHPQQELIQLLKSLAA